MNILVQQRYLVSGMSCAACARSVESLLKATDGVSGAAVNYGTNSAVVDFDSARVSTQEFHEALLPYGYDLVPALRDASDQLELRQSLHLSQMRRRSAVALILCVPLMFLGMRMPTQAWMNVVQFTLSAIVIGYCGRDFYVHAFRLLRRRSVSMDTLIALSTGLAFLWSTAALVASDWLHAHGIRSHLYFESAAVIIAFVLLGKVLEEGAKRQSSTALQSLQSLQPRSVVIVRDDTSVETEVQNLRRGDTVLIRPGERVAVDGIVIRGQSYCDESLLSGESVPILKSTGMPVYAGTLNQTSAMQVQTRSVGEDTMLAYIRRSVQEAQESHITAQRLVDFVSARFVPGVIILSILSFIGWLMFAGTAEFGQAFSSMIAVLIVACPCALGLAAPIALVVGIGRAAQNGILVKNAEALERASTISDVVFDKTGTLSETDLQVSAQSWMVSESQIAKLHAVLYSMELESHHPYAQAIVLDAQHKGVLRVELESCQEQIGKGITATFEGQVYMVGSASYVHDLFPNVVLPDTEVTLIFANRDMVLCSMRIDAALRSGVRELVHDLHELGIRTHILSGDRVHSVSSIAKSAGINDFRAECTPMMKEQEITALQQQGKVVAMVGDGINDAQSLARADVSFAMGRGTDTAANASHVVLMNSDISKLLPTIRLARHTLRIIKQNLWWAFMYNLLLIPLAAGVLYPMTGLQLDPMLAGAAMALSSVSVVMNSLRLKRVRV